MIIMKTAAIIKRTYNGVTEYRVELYDLMANLNVKQLYAFKMYVEASTQDPLEIVVAITQKVTP